MRTEFLPTRTVLWVIGLFLAALVLLALSGCAAAPTAEAQQVAPPIAVYKDDVNGILCEASLNWGECFPYTPTPQLTLSPSVTPSVTPTPRYNTSTPTPSQTELPPPTYTRTRVPPTQPPPVSEELLVNPSFEGDGGWISYFTQTSAPGKEPGVARAPKGDGPFAGLVLDGNYSMRVKGEYMCWQGGVYQVVPTYIGQPLRLSAWVSTWSNSTDWFEFDSDVNTWQSIKAGIDPKGGQDASQSRIEWTEKYGGAGWQELVVETYAAAPKATVFLFVNLGYRYPNECMWPLKNNWAMFDLVSLR